MGGVYITGFEPTLKLIPEEFLLSISLEEGGVLESHCQLMHLKRQKDQSINIGCRFTQVDPGSLQSYLRAI